MANDCFKKADTCEFNTKCEAYFKGSYTCEYRKLQDCKLYPQFVTGEISSFTIPYLTGCVKD